MSRPGGDALLCCVKNCGALTGEIRRRQSITSWHYWFAVAPGAYLLVAVEAAAIHHNWKRTPVYSHLPSTTDEKECAFMLCADLPASVVRITRKHVIYELADFYSAAPAPNRRDGESLCACLACTFRLPAWVRDNVKETHRTAATHVPYADKLKININCV